MHIFNFVFHYAPIFGWRWPGPPPPPPQGVGAPPLGGGGGGDQQPATYNLAGPPPPCGLGGWELEMLAFHLKTRMSRIIEQDRIYKTSSFQPQDFQLTDSVS